MRYQNAMIHHATAEETAELVIHLGRAARLDDGHARLTPAQWTALRFLSRANDSSRTPSAFASFHATTRGTATQTLKALEAKGLIERRQSPDDGRSVRFAPTTAGLALLANDPLRDLAEAILALPADLQAALAMAMPQVVSQLAARRDVPSFGTCRDCRHYEDGRDGAYCACMAAGLAAGETDLLCINFALEPAPPALR